MENKYCPLGKIHCERFIHVTERGWVRCSSDLRDPYRDTHLMEYTFEVCPIPSHQVKIEEPKWPTLDEVLGMTNQDWMTRGADEIKKKILSEIRKIMQVHSYEILTAAESVELDK